MDRITEMPVSADKSLGAVKSRIIRNGMVSDLREEFHMQFSVIPGQQLTIKTVKNALSINCLPSVSLRLTIFLPCQSQVTEDSLQICCQM